MRSPGPALSLSRWAWRAFVTTTLLPLLWVEGALLVTYLVTSSVTYDRNAATLEHLAREALDQAARREVALVEARLSQVSSAVAMLADRTAEALATPYTPPAAERARHVLTSSGAYVSTSSDGAALYISGYVPVTDALIERAHRLAQLDPLMRTLVRHQRMVVQAYVNTEDCISRIHPYVDPLTVFAPRMNTPSYNFYYEADAAHDPERRPVWTEAYLDPAGKGWIVSAIAPVYQGDALVAVAGLDVTLASVIDQVLRLQLPWGGYGMLVGQDGTILALPAAGEAELGLRELTSHHYSGAVVGDTLKPAAFNVNKNPRLASLAALLAERTDGQARLMLGGARIAAWHTLAETGWVLLVLVPEDAVLADAARLRADTEQVGALMLVALMLFYAVFLAFLWRRARRQTAVIAQPLLAFNRAVRQIAAGRFEQPPIPSEIRELAETGEELRAMGRKMQAQRELEEQQDAAVRAAQAEARAHEAASRAKSRFLAQVSHEIRTPMNVVLGSLDLLHRGTHDPTQREQLRAVRASAESLLAILNELLDASKIEAGALHIEHARFEPAALVRDVVQLHRPLADARGLTLTVAVDAGTPTHAWGDALRLRQVLTNLLENALKFTHRGGVRVELSPRPDGLRFAVIDTGIGIARDKLALILEPFAQADDSITRQYGGTGLGLTISARLVELMGGRLSIESTVGEGSAFSFVLPPPRVAAEARTGAPPAPAPEGRRSLHVLVAEDDPINRQLIVRMLELLGHRAVATAHGKDALAQYAPGRFDVGLFDVHMPEMDGRTLTRALREREGGRTPRLHVFALTASAMPDEAAACLAAGMDAVLTKPILVDGLGAALAQVPPAPRDGAEARA